MLELLSPAGSMEALRAAVQNGANAVYLGCGSFNARQSAKNFTPQTLVEAIKYCHIRGVQVHLAVNTLVADREMREVAELIRHAAQNNVDAFIVQDLGVVQLCRQIAPKVPIHGSTQMTVHSLAGVQLCAAMGMRRVVLSRELTREEIRYICAGSPIEIEVFAHGALCMCYSGQCYMSAVIGGRSGNRGRCAQPCRQSYGYGRWQDKYPLSLKDNCLVHYLQELEAMGVASIKLEGRMKRPEYVATVTAVYRKALDEGAVTRPMMDALMTAFNRQGFTDGYYTGRVDQKMFGVRQETREDGQWLQAARQSYEAGETPLVDLKFYAAVTVDGSYLTATDPEGRVCRSDGPRPELARNQVRTHVEPGLIISASAINAMRRDVLNQLTALRARRDEQPIRKPKAPSQQRGGRGLPGLTVQVTTREQLTPTLLNLETAMLYVPIDQTGRLSRYSGSERTPRLSKLGGKEFEKLKEGVRRSLREMAINLVQLYSERMQAKGFKYSPDTSLQTEFEQSFEYEETPDQRRATDEIKSDMERGIVMDRLLCGDVGYGKTEVALRAVFKTVTDGKSAVIMAPTTVLARQHYNTASARFAPWGLKVELLTRYQSAEEIRGSLERLATGVSLIAVATHRLLGKDVRFHDLGLLVLDEEQRFGVEQKEKLKEKW